MDVVLASDRKEVNRIVNYLNSRNINVLYLVSNKLSGSDVNNNIPVKNRFLKNDSNKYNLLISYYYGSLLEPNNFNEFKMAVNFHPGPLPYYKGVKCGVHAIINREKKFGVSCHLIDDKFDNGELIGLKEFYLDENETGYSLYNKSKDALFSLFVEFIEKEFFDPSKILFTTIDETAYVVDEPTYYSNKDFNKIRCLNGKDLYSEETYYILSALWHPEFVDAYYINKASKKINISKGGE